MDATTTHRARGAPRPAPPPTLPPSQAESGRDARPDAGPPPRRGLYYGWVILGVAGMGMFMSGPGQSYSMAAFVDPMLVDLGIPRSQYSLAYLVATLVSGATLPFLGRLVDRRGARLVLPALALLLGCACLGMARVRHLPELYLGLAAIRCLGQGALTLTSTWLVGQWFDRRRGLAMGLLGLGSALSFMAFPAGNLMLIESHGWRGAWVGLAACEWVLLMLPALFLVRNRPEDLGLEGDRFARPASPSATASGLLADPSPSWTAGQACRTGAFWKVVAALCTSSMVSTGLIFHQVSLLAERGVSKELAISTLSLQALFACLMTLFGGYLADRVPPRHLLSASMVFLALALLLVLGVGTPALVLPYSVLLGLHTGIQRCSGALALLGAFGRPHFGSIKGRAMALVIASAALGPLPLAMAKDHLGSYDLVLAALLLPPVASAWAVWSARPPRYPDVADEPTDHGPAPGIPECPAVPDGR